MVLKPTVKRIVQGHSGRPHGLLRPPSPPMIALDFQRCVLLKVLIISGRAYACRHLAAPKSAGAGHNSRAIPTRLLSIIGRSSDAGARGESVDGA